MQGKRVFLPNQSSGDPPLRGSRGVGAPYGKRIEWQCIASCRGPECKLNSWLFPPKVLMTHPLVGHLLCARRMGSVFSGRIGSVLIGTSSPHVEAQSASDTIGFPQPVFW